MPRPEQARDSCDRILDAIETVVVGKREQAKMLTAALTAGGHVLVEDVPGVGKTLLARTFAAVTGLSFRRIQFTPDLLPSDVTGTHVFSQKDGEFHWRPGPVFANMLLADELNRATPRTQSSLLEAMEERQVTSEGESRPLPSPFMVIATQNPIEMEGTFPLPEAQLDRFLLRIEMGYPSGDQEALVLKRFAGPGGPSLEKPKILTCQATTGTREYDTLTDLVVLRDATDATHLSPEVTEYILSIARKTREHKGLALGVSPRGALYLARVSKVWAALDGRDYVLPDDVKKMAIPCLSHRLIPRAQASLRGKTGKDVVAEILDEVPVPVGCPAPAGGPTSSGDRVPQGGGGAQSERGRNGTQF